MPQADGAHTKLVNATLKFLHMRRVFAYKQNTGAMKRGDRYVRFSIRGAADIIACINGIFVGIECKTGSGSLTDDQKHYRDELLSAGGAYIVAHTLDDVADYLDKGIQNHE